MKRMDLNQSPYIAPLLRNRWPQFLIRAVTLAGFIFTILAGLIGSEVGSNNFAVIFVWIAWWSALKLFFIPLGGRSWCSICPIPMPGEWLQNEGIFKPRRFQSPKRKNWPKALRGNWLQAFAFLLIGLFGAVILTSPRVTALILLGLIIVAFILSLIFERRSFCLYLCPIGGFTGLYAKLAPLEVRTKKSILCAEHDQKTCYQACPWGQYPLALKSSANCGLCMECLRVCPYDNISVNIRPWGEEILRGSKSTLDETFLGLLMLTTALADAAIFLGPWGKLKSAAYLVGTPAWWWFVIAFLLGALFLIPGLYLLAVWSSTRLERSGNTLRSALTYFSPFLLPLGLTGWIAFTISFAFTKFSYLLPVLSDPLGWGWNLLGLSGKNGVGEISPLSSFLQIVVIAAGMFWAARTARKLSNSYRQVMPLVMFIASFGITMLWLLIG
jgi:ferredoxin